MVGRGRRGGGVRRWLGAGLVLAIGAVGTVVGVGSSASAGISPYHRFAGVGAGQIADGGAGCAGPGPARELAFTVSGVPTGSPLTGVRVSGLLLAHPRVGDLTLTLIAPDGTAHVLFSRTGVSVDRADGYDAALLGPYAFSDDHSTEWWTWASGAEVPAGRYFSTAPGAPERAGPVRTGITEAFAGLADPNGDWRLRLTDQCQGPSGPLGEVRAATLDVKTAADDMNSCIAEGMRTASAQVDLAAAEEVLAAARSALAAAATQRGATEFAHAAAATAAGAAATTAAAAQSAAVLAAQAAKQAAKALSAAKKRAERSETSRAKVRVKKARKALRAARAKQHAAAAAAGSAATGSASAHAAAAAASTVAAQAVAGRAAADAAYDAARSAWQSARDRVEEVGEAEAFCLDS